MLGSVPTYHSTFEHVEAGVAIDSLIPAKHSVITTVDGANAY